MGKVLAIGDIHTKSWIMEWVVNAMSSYDKVVFCGDYADDFNAGPKDTLSTWKLLKSLQSKFPNKINLVLGNHDYIYVYDTPSLQTGYNHITYTLINSPENKDLKEWLLKMPVTLEIDGVTYSHAGITNEWSGIQDANNLWGDNSPIWARPYGSVTYKDKPQVFGHTPMETCLEVQPYVWCIDTFSTMPDGSLCGDGSALEVIDGKKFAKILLRGEKRHDNSRIKRLT